MDSPSTIDRELFNVPIISLNVTCRTRLAMMLNQEITLPTSVTRDWRGLAEVLSFDYQSIMFIRECPDPTARLLDMWQNESNATVGYLLQCLELIDRFDVIDDLKAFIDRDVELYRRKERLKQIQMESQRPIQESTVSSPEEVPSQLTIHDNDVELASYDAYVSYVSADSQFVSEMIQKLEGEYKLKLYVKDRDLLPGVVETDADIQLMQDRCRRILVVLSPDFLNNPRGEFQTMFAHAVAIENNPNNRKIIPIIYRECSIPARLKFLAYLDYTKGDMFASFWNRLYKSIGVTSTVSTNHSSLLVPYGQQQPDSKRSPVMTHSSGFVSGPSSGFVSDCPSSSSSSYLGVQQDAGASPSIAGNVRTPSPLQNSGNGGGESSSTRSQSSIKARFKFFKKNEKN